jgi:hypothetical protein
MSLPLRNIYKIDIEVIMFPDLSRLPKKGPSVHVQAPS